MQRKLLIAATLAAFTPMMAVGGYGGGTREREKIKIEVWNHGDSDIDVPGAGDDSTIKARGSKKLELDDASDFAVIVEKTGTPAKLEIVNKSQATLDLRADGAGYSIKPGQGLSLTVQDVDTLELIDTSAVAQESQGAQAGSNDTPEGAESNTHAAGPEGEAAPESDTVRGGVAGSPPPNQTLGVGGRPEVTSNQAGGKPA